jgi:hypothetical protein
MSALTNYGENLLLDWMFTAGAATRPTAWYVALHTADPTEVGTTSEVLVGSDSAYTRKTVTFAAASGGQSLSTLQVAHTPAVAAGSYTVTHVSICDAATAGNDLMKAALLVPRLISNANPLVIAAGDIVAALD